MTRINDRTSTVQPSASPRRRRRTQQAGHPWGDGVPTLAALAAPYGLRVYRDKCGDENIPGRFGEIFRYGPACLAVQFGGSRANGTPVRDRRKVRWRMQQATRTIGLRCVVGGETEAIFHCPDALLPEVATLMGAYRTRGAPRQSVPLPEAA